MRRCAAALLACILPVTALAATATDLRTRITIDGNLGDFTPDEWVVDPATTPPEPPGDSRWGRDNDISAIAVTWDQFAVYIGVAAVTRTSTLMLVLGTACGGFESMAAAGPFARNVEFSGFRANVIVRATAGVPDVTLAAVDCDHPLSTVDPGLYQGIYVQDGAADGALEIAVPWELLGAFENNAPGTVVPPGSGVLRALAFVTGGSATGAGDAAPNPSVALENDSTRVAILNNYLELRLDADGDGIVDVGVTPRTAATFPVTQAEESRAVLPLRVVLQTKLVEPGNGVPLSFYATLDPPTYNQNVYVTAAVYSADGRLLRKLYEDAARDLSQGAAPVIDTWDGRDHRGNLAPGGIYVLAVSGGPGIGAPKTTVKASFAVVR